MKLLKNKNVLIVGVANKHSIASGIASCMSSHGANLAFTYQNERFKDKVTALAKGWNSNICLPLIHKWDNKVKINNVVIIYVIIS